MHYSRVRKEGRQGAKCSCSGSSHSKAKESGKKWCLRSSLPHRVTANENPLVKQEKDGVSVRITYINGRHNHPCYLAYAAIVQQLSGRDIQSVLPILAMPFAPYLF